MQVLPLNEGHNRKEFNCGDSELNNWLIQIARQHKEKGVSSTFVAVPDSASAKVLGFYAISVAELINSDLPAQARKRLPVRVPVFRLGRLAIDRSEQGRGIGEFLLFDAIDRVTRIADEVGGIGLVVNAKPSAIEFYRQYGFEQMMDHPLNLLLRF